ncbi:hypothetical protein ACROYT_G025388 [Oculina patagonica]
MHNEREGDEPSPSIHPSFLPSLNNESAHGRSRWNRQEQRKHTWDHLYSTAYARNVDTLYHLCQKLGKSNISSDAKKNYKAAAEFIHEVTKSSSCEAFLEWADPRDDNCGEANPVSDVPYDISHVVKSAEKLSDADKVQFLENCWRPTPSCSNLNTQYWKSGNLNKHINCSDWVESRDSIAHGL